MKASNKIYAFKIAFLILASVFFSCTNSTQNSAPPPNPAEEKLTLSFDSGVECKKGQLGNEGDVTSGTAVEENDWYSFKALGLVGNEIVEAWYVNGNKKSEKQNFRYEIKKEDADSGNVINVTYKKKNSDKIVLTFAGNIECKKGFIGDEGDVTTRSPVEEGDYYRFTPLDLADGEIVEGWYINGNKKREGSNFPYQIKKSDADSDNIINITYEKKIAKKITLTFAGNIKCEKGYFGGDGDITTGTTVKEMDAYQFTALGLTSDEIVDAWYINGKKRKEDQVFRYVVVKTDADYDDVINVTYKKKTAEKAILKFDSGTIECKKGSLGYGGDVVTETEVKERDWYRFTAKLNSGEAVKNWLINGKPKSFSNKTEYTYQVKQADFAPDKTITVSFEKL